MIRVKYENASDYQGFAILYGLPQLARAFRHPGLDPGSLHVEQILNLYFLEYCMLYYM